MDPPPIRRRSMATSSSSEVSVVSPGTLVDDPAEKHVRPSAEEWYPRLYLGWNHKECVDVYCYFTAPPFHADLEIVWAINPLGPPFHGKRHPISFNHILQLVDTQSNSDAVKRAIAVGLSTQYHAQERFKEDAPVYRHIEPTSEEILVAWEDHSLNISEDDNVQKVKDAVMSTFGFNMRKDDVELLKRFSTLNRVSIFETNTWRQMMCFKCCPKKKGPGSPAAPISRKENLRKRKSSEDSAEPAPKRLALPVSEEAASNTDLAISTTAADGQALIVPEQEEVAAATSSTDLVSRLHTNVGEASNAPRLIEGVPATASSADMVTTTSIDSIQALSSPGEFDTTQRDQPPTPAISVNSAFSTTLTIASWLRLLPAVKLHSGNTSNTVQK
ncbi:hypothetical protein DL98DRAFT_612651 [Cadophora sp. DSE1049]|nr:hypothetical protein DL98DRAFT_612651 [Cadophora sp. DSE1049]